MKKSGYLERQARLNEAMMKHTQDGTRQLVFDLFAINLRQNGISEERTRKILESVDLDWNEFADIWNDKNTVERDGEVKTYAKEKLDRILRQLCPKYFVPWEERYKW